MKRGILTYFFIAAISFQVIHGCTSRTDVESKKEPNGETIDGATLARAHCSRCHLYPSPELLDRKSWSDKVLPQMAFRFGIYKTASRDSLLGKGLTALFLHRAEVFPEQQTISDADWRKITEFYITHAPDTLPRPKRDLLKKLTGFKFWSPPFKAEHPLVTKIKYEGASRKLYLTNTKGDHTALHVLDKEFKPILTLGLPDPVADLQVRGDTLLALMIGSLTPSDVPSGILIRAVQNKEGEYNGYSIVVKDLKRPVDSAFADIDGDGLEDVVICEFGNHTGRVSLFKNNGNGTYRRQVLFDQPGAVSVIVADVNKDLRKDIVVLMAQGDEGIDIYFNSGNGDFRRERVLRFPPVWGSMSIELTDFNRDGFYDIIYVNGDNADYSPVLKPYHGMRLFLNDRTNRFSEAYFFPFHGGYQSLTRDFDSDGDMDVAMIAFFPDFFNDEKDAFVYLENVSRDDQIQFSAATFPECENGRWIAMEAADIDEDGDEDIVLGSFTGMDISRDKDRALIERYIKESPAFIVLENSQVR